MADNRKTDLYTAIEETALAAYGGLLAPELAHAAATSFARETTEMVEDLLSDSAEVLRERIEGQLAALSGGLGKPAKKKRSVKKVEATDSEPESAPEAEVSEGAPVTPRKRITKPKA